MPAQASCPPGVESGFHLLYEIRFPEARSEFLAWEKANPQDPLGHAWEAASYLFEELYHHDVLTSEFFLDDVARVDNVGRSGDGKFGRRRETHFDREASGSDSLADGSFLARKVEPNLYSPESIGKTWHKWSVPPRGGSAIS